MWSMVGPINHHHAIYLKSRNDLLPRDVEIKISCRSNLSIQYNRRYTSSSQALLTLLQPAQSNVILWK